MRPRQQAIDAEIAMFDVNAPAAFAGADGAKDLEAEHPGLNDKLIAATRGVLVNHAPASEDRLRERLAVILHKDLTTAQMTALTDFFQSSAGLAIIEQAQTASTSVQSDQFVDAVKSKEVKTSHFVGMQREAASKVRLTNLQEAALLRFMQTPAWAGLVKVRPKLIQAQADYANEPDPELDSAIESATRKVMDEVLGAEE